MMKKISQTVMILMVMLISAPIWSAEQRIISAGGSVTEILYALGMGDKIIAVDSSSYYPYEAQKKPQVGYFRSLSAEGVLELKPTLIAAANGAGPDEALQQIQQTGVEVKVFRQEIYNLDTWQQYMAEIGDYFGLSEKANAIIDRVQNNIGQIQAQNENTAKKNGIFIMSINDRGPLVAGNNTVPDMLLSLANYNNLAKDINAYKPFSTEELITLKPDLIVMPSHVVERMGGKSKVCENLVIKLATQDKGCDILVMDALLALGFGTRIDEAVNILVNQSK